MGTGYAWAWHSNTKSLPCSSQNVLLFMAEGKLGALAPKGSVNKLDYDN